MHLGGSQGSIYPISSQRISFGFARCIGHGVSWSRGNDRTMRDSSFSSNSWPSLVRRDGERRGCLSIRYYVFTRCLKIAFFFAFSSYFLSLSSADMRTLFYADSDVTILHSVNESLIPSHCDSAVMFYPQTFDTLQWVTWAGE
jgi:hypothetical protein